MQNPMNCIVCYTLYRDGPGRSVRLVYAFFVFIRADFKTKPRVAFRIDHCPGAVPSFQLRRNILPAEVNIPMIESDSKLHLEYFKNHVNFFQT